MSTTSPLPGLLRAPKATPARAGSPVPPPQSWISRAVALEPFDTPGRIAIAASTLAAAFALGDIVFNTGFIGIFHYKFARLILYGGSLLSGIIMAAGFMSSARTARFTAVLATSTIAAYALAVQLQLPDAVFPAIRLVYGIGLLGAAAIAAFRAWGRRLTRGSEAGPE